MAWRKCLTCKLFQNLPARSTMHPRVAKSRSAALGPATDDIMICYFNDIDKIIAITNLQKKYFIF
jgi:hypothetical protein